MLTERYELLDGEIILKVGQNQPHAMTVSRVVFYLMGVFGPERVQTQTDIEVAVEDQATNRPQPDVAVLSQPDYEYTDTPQGTDLVLVVEVSHTTLRDDLRTKAPLYARAGIPEYWVMDVSGRRLLAHQEPVDGVYARVTAYTEEEIVATPAVPAGNTRVTDLLPPSQAATQPGN